MIKETDGGETTIDYNVICLAQSKPKSLEDGIRLIRQTLQNRFLSTNRSRKWNWSDLTKNLCCSARKVDKQNGEITVRCADCTVDKKTSQTDIQISAWVEAAVCILSISTNFASVADTGFWVVTVENFKRCLAIPDIRSYKVGKN